MLNEQFILDHGFIYSDALLDDPGYVLKPALSNGKRVACYLHLNASSPVLLMTISDHSNNEVIRWSVHGTKQEFLELLPVVKEICNYGIILGYQGPEDSMLSRNDLNNYRFVRLSPHLYGRLTVDEKHIEIYLFQNIEKQTVTLFCSSILSGDPVVPHSSSYNPTDFYYTMRTLNNEAFVAMVLSKGLKKHSGIENADMFIAKKKDKQGQYWTIHLKLDHIENKMQFHLALGDQAKQYECPMNRHHFEVAYNEVLAFVKN